MKFEWTIELRFLVALALGFLIGLERESIKADHQGRMFAGVRTFPIISMYGFGCAWLYNLGTSWMLPVGGLSVGALAVASYVGKLKEGRAGSTTEVTALLTFLTGALALLADVWIAMAIGVVNTILLSEKAELESYVERLNRVEFLAVIKFILVTAIVLPVLPDIKYTQFRLNPARIWQLVILVSSVGFVGYLLARKLGTSLGMWLSGVFGGIVSSTAVAVASGRIARRHPGRSGAALQASILASSVMYIRILVLIWAIMPGIVSLIWWRLLLLCAMGVLISATVRSTQEAPDVAEISTLQNPFELRPAIAFAGLFVFITIVTGLLQEAFGNTGILILSALVGVTDIDPFILSLIQGTESTLPVVIPALIIAMSSNTLAKGVYFAVLSPERKKDALWRYAGWALIHVPVAFT